MTLNVVTHGSKEKGSINLRDNPCQICTRKRHGDLDFHNRIDISKFPPTHGRTLSTIGSTKAANASVNMIYDISVWYPDSGATNHVTNDVANIQKISSYEGNRMILLQMVILCID